MPGVCNYGYVPLSHLGNIVMRTGKTTSFHNFLWEDGKTIHPYCARNGTWQLPQWVSLFNGPKHVFMKIQIQACMTESVTYFFSLEQLWMNKFLVQEAGALGDR